jgi:hypothetical protein
LLSISILEERSFQPITEKGEEVRAQDKISDKNTEDVDTFTLRYFMLRNLRILWHYLSYFMLRIRKLVEA